MRKCLFNVLPAACHVYPNLPIARALAAQGWEVSFFFATSNLPKGVGLLVTRENFKLLTLPDQKPSWLREHIRKQPGLRPNGVMRRLMERGFSTFQEAADAVDHLKELLKQYKPELICVTPFTYTAAIAAELTQIPWATLSMFPGWLPGPDAHPAMFAFPPPRNALGKAMFRVMNYLSEKLYRSLDPEINEIRRLLRLRPLQNAFQLTNVSPYLYLELCPLEFQYPRNDWPQQLHFVGPSLWKGHADYRPPEWFGDPEEPRPMVYVTGGVLEDDLASPVFFQTALDALQDFHGMITVNLGAYEGFPEGFHLEARKNDVILEAFLPPSLLESRADVIVHNGAYCSMMSTLESGVPAVISSYLYEQHDNASRCKFLGSAQTIPRKRLTSARLRKAVETVLSDARYRQRAADLKRVFHGYKSSQTAADLLIELARTAKPVLRT